MVLVFVALGFKVTTPVSSLAGFDVIAPRGQLLIRSVSFSKWPASRKQRFMRDSFFKQGEKQSGICSSSEQQFPSASWFVVPGQKK